MNNTIKIKYMEGCDILYIKTEEGKLHIGTVDWNNYVPIAIKEELRNIITGKELNKDCSDYEYLPMLDSYLIYNNNFSVGGYVANIGMLDNQYCPEILERLFNIMKRR